MNVRSLIQVLNNLTVGEFSRLEGRVREARDETRRQGLDEITAILDEALVLLRSGDVKGFRRKVQHAVSRLGHAAS